MSPRGVLALWGENAGALWGENPAEIILNNHDKMTLKNSLLHAY